MGLFFKFSQAASIFWRHLNSLRKEGFLGKAWRELALEGTQFSGIKFKP